MFKPVVLIILDGWGLAPPGPGNAITQAKTPHLSRLSQAFPNLTLTASGEAVGLPKGEAGNTETGHLNLGAGHIVYQDLPRINQSIADGSFFQNQAFLQAIKHAQNFNSNLHLMGLVGAGGVHSSLDHLFALLRLTQNLHFFRVYLHLFTDGRDSPPTSALTFVETVSKHLRVLGFGSIATLMGRYYAMDRDLRWDRTQAAYTALTEGRGDTTTSPSAAIKAAYAKNITDEFIRPTIIISQSNQPLPRIQTNDAVIFFNFRIDRPRQLTRAFVLPNFEPTAMPTSFDPYAVKYYKTHQPQITPPTRPFTRAVQLKNLFFVTMTEYEPDLPVTVAFPPQPVPNPLGKVVSAKGLKQLRLAETEKEHFVTYYFNGLRRDPFPQEDRIIIPSPKVTTYDLKPAMSAPQITEALLDRTASGIYDLFVVNFANADMVGHTGNIQATITACQVVDDYVGKIALNIIGQGGALVITADHGNAEEMIHSLTGAVETEHSTNPVPCIIAADKFTGLKSYLDQGILADVAPTILKLLDLPQPDDMTGKALI